MNTLSADYRLPGFIANMANYGTCQSNKRGNGEGALMLKGEGAKSIILTEFIGPWRININSLIAAAAFAGKSQRKTIRVININLIALAIW